MRAGNCVQIGLGGFPEYIHLTDGNWRESQARQDEIYRIDERIFEGLSDEPWNFYGIDCDPHSIAKVSQDFGVIGHWILAYVAGLSGGLREIVSLCFRDKAADGMFVPVMSLMDIVVSLGIDEIDVLAVDIEGVEVELFESLNWNWIRPRFIAVEIHSYGGLATAKAQIMGCLQRQGYLLLSETPTNVNNPFPTLEVKFIHERFND